MYSFSKSWHICQWFRYNHKCKIRDNQMKCHKGHIKEGYKKEIEKIVKEQKDLQEKQLQDFEMEKRKIEEAKKAGEVVEGLGPKLKPLPKKDPISYEPVEQGFELI